MVTQDVGVLCPAPYTWNCVWAEQMVGGLGPLWSAVLKEGGVADFSLWECPWFIWLVHGHAWYSIA